MQQGSHAHHVPPALPTHPSQRRDYHHYYHPPQSPIPPNMYSYHPQYYGHPVPPPQYQWRPPYPQQHYVPPPYMQPPYQPRSPMVVSSQPHGQPMTPVTRHQSTHSPRPMHPYMHSQAPAASPSPAPMSGPVLVPTPKLEEPRHETPPPQTPQTARRPSTSTNPLSLPPEHKQPFWPSVRTASDCRRLPADVIQLPWYSTAEGRATFPSRATPRRRRRRHLRTTNEALALPTRDGSSEEPENAQAESQATSAEELPSEISTIAAPSEPETPATSQAPSESDYTLISTPATPAQAPISSPKSTPTQQQHVRKDTRTAIAVPHMLGPHKPSQTTPPSTAKTDGETEAQQKITPKVEEQQVAATEEEGAPKDKVTPQTPAPKPVLKSWADLVRQNTKPAPSTPAMNGEVTSNGIQVPKSAPLAEALRQYHVQSDMTLPFLEPRGLVNTGNMCYMNSVCSCGRAQQEH